MPCAFVVNRGVKIFPMFSWDMPVPVSEKEISTVFFFLRLRISSFPSIGHCVDCILDDVHEDAGHFPHINFHAGLIKSIIQHLDFAWNFYY